MSWPSWDFKRYGLFRRLARGEADEAINAQLSTASMAFPSVDNVPSVQDVTFSRTQDLWHAVISEQLRAGTHVILRNVLLTEWLPRSPGLYGTEEARAVREDAKRRLMPLTQQEHRL